MATMRDCISEGNKLLGRGYKFDQTLQIKCKLECKLDDNDPDIEIEDEQLDLFDQIDGANKFISDIDECVRQIYRSVRDSYSKRFPELNVSVPMQYLLIAKVLANDPGRIAKDDTVRNQLSEVLEPKILLLVNMAAPTTRGVKLEGDEMTLILQACEVGLRLIDLRAKALDFVESNMTTIAPNLSVIVGAAIAAKLMGKAGGLAELAAMPSCNATTMGSHKTSKIELSTSAPVRTGYIYECDLIQQIPFDNINARKKAVRWVANKCVLAARCDLNKSDNQAGCMFRAKIQALIDKALEPPPKKASRPLPAPIEKSGKRRGGKRSRKARERFAKTELRKAANRINFNDVGSDYDPIGKLLSSRKGGKPSTSSSAAHTT